jgi:hypothetical protein
MLPFRADVAELGDRVASVMGRHHAKTRSFVTTPLLDPDEQDRDPRDRYAFPRAGTPIVLLTDLGIASVGEMERASVEDWLRYAAEARQARNPVIAFVPYKPARVAVALRQTITVIPWDRRTSIRDVHRARRPNQAARP